MTAEGGPASGRQAAIPECHSFKLTAMTVDAGELAADRVRLRTLRRSLGAHLATYHYSDT
jgi:hypothetical protein